MTRKTCASFETLRSFYPRLFPHNLVTIHIKKEGWLIDTRDLILYLAQAKKRTPVKIYLKEKESIDLTGIRVFGCTDKILFGDWEEIRPVLERNREKIADMVIENDRRNSGIPLLDTKDIQARIEPGAILRDSVSIGKNAVIMMGAVLNIGACVGEETMIDMGAVLGAQAKVGKRCHIGAGAVLAGVLEPPSAKPVIVEDEVLIGANAVVLEGVRIGKGAVIAAGAVVTENVEAGMVAAGMPARIIKRKDDGTEKKTGMIKELRCL